MYTNYNDKYTNIQNEYFFPGFKDKIKTLYKDSLDNYHKNINLYDKEKYNNDISMFDTSIRVLKYYYADMANMGFITKENYLNVHNQIRKLKLLKIFPNDDRSLYGLTQKYEISINPEIPSKKMLNSNEMKFLCVSHELGHIINTEWELEAINLAKKLYIVSNENTRKIMEELGINSYKYIKEGLYLLDEVVAEEVAEAVTFNHYDLSRPPMKKHNDKIIFKNKSYVSNYILYGEFQDFATKFAREILDFSDNVNTEKVLKKLSTTSFEKNFINKIGMKIFDSKKEKRNMYILMLACMGKIKIATYGVVNIYDTNDTNVNEHVKVFNNVYYKQR